MGNTYVAGSGVDRDRVRLLLADTSLTTYVFHDAELDDFLDLQGGDIFLAAATGMRVLAVNAGKRELWYQVTGLLVDRRGSTRAILAVAESLEKRALAEPWELESVLDYFVTETGEDRSQYVTGPTWP